MKIESENKQAVLALESCGAELSAYPSLCFSIEFKSRDVSCVVAEVWIEIEKMRGFLNALETLDTTRQGEAALEGISPGELGLRIFPLDGRGHIGLEVKLMGMRWIGDNHKRIEYGCHTSFELDPTALSHITNDFRSLINKQRDETV